MYAGNRDLYLGYRSGRFARSVCVRPRDIDARPIKWTRVDTRCRADGHLSTTRGDLGGYPLNLILQLRRR